jgi:hypothetical protein
VQLGLHRSRPRRTVRGAACGYAGHGPRARRWRGPRPCGPRPRPAQRARRTATRCATGSASAGAARAHEWRTAHSGATRCGAARQADGGTVLAHGRWRGTAAHRRGDGGATRRPGGTAAVRATRLRTAAVRARAVGAAARSGRRREGRGGGRGRGACGEATFGRARSAGHCPDSALSRAIGVARGSHPAAARYREGPLRRATADKRGPLSAIIELKIYPEGN